MDERRNKRVKRDTDITSQVTSEQHRDWAALQEVFESLQDVLLLFQSITNVCIEERRREVGGREEQYRVSHAYWQAGPPDSMLLSRIGRQLESFEKSRQSLIHSTYVCTNLSPLSPPLIPLSLCSSLPYAL